ncbi:hypothetical protein Peur_071715 [Populus x canadensis]
MVASCLLVTKEACLLRGMLFGSRPGHPMSWNLKYHVLGPGFIPLNYCFQICMIRSFWINFEIWREVQKEMIKELSKFSLQNLKEQNPFEDRGFFYMLLLNGGGWICRVCRYFSAFFTFANVLLPVHCILIKLIREYIYPFTF